MRPIIIAEAGINHRGSKAKAKEYITAAARAGADYIKFHMAYANRMVNVKQKQILWNDAHPVDIEPVDEFVKRVELSLEDISDLVEFSKVANIKFMVSCYDLESINDALDIGIKNIKLASCDFVREDFVTRLNNRADEVFLATGMVDSVELNNAKRYIDNAKTHVMHCISLYPTPFNKLNLNFINTLKEFGWSAGYSDHTSGIGACVASLNFDPSCIEKHFMLDSDCADEKVSCYPRELEELVNISKSYRKIFGSGERDICEEEYENRKKFRNRW